MNKLTQLIKSSLKNHMLRYNIGATIISKLGYADVNLAGQNAKYRAFNKLRKKYSKLIGKTSFKSYKNDEEEKVWICWLQGIENAPEPVKSCYASMRYHLKDKNIVDINSRNVKEYITLPDYIYDKWERGIIPNAQFSDIVRLQLLIEHGGLWLDATVYLTDGLPDYITDGDFFVFHDGFFNCDVVNMGNWLIYSKANNILLQETQNLLLTYWKENNYLQHYFIKQLFFRMVTDYYSEEWEKVPYYNQMDQHIFSMEINQEFNEKRFNQIKSITSIHKLSYKIDETTLENNSYFSKLSELYLK